MPTELDNEIKKLVEHVRNYTTAIDAFTALRGTCQKSTLINWFNFRYGWDGGRDRNAFDAFQIFFKDVHGGKFSKI